MKYLLMILFIPCLLFSQKVYDVKTYPFNAKGDGVTDDRAAIQKAIDTAFAHNGKVLFPSGTFKFSDTLRIRANTVLAGAGKYSTILKQITLNRNGINIRGDSVTIKDLSIVGTNDTASAAATQPTKTQYAGIYCIGDSVGARRINVEISNCLIRNFNYGIVSFFNRNFIFKDGTIDSVFLGIWGGTGGAGSQTFNDDTTLSWEILDSKITCTYGALTHSRPVSTPYHSGKVTINRNTLRGGGMSFENVVSEVGAKASTKGRIVVINNDCDAGISQINICSNNILDGRNAPTGRGNQNNWWLAIEPLRGAAITGNIIRHFVNGVGVFLVDCIVKDNQFDSCGAIAYSGNGGVITMVTGGGFDNVRNAIISNNKFSGTIGMVYDIYMNIGFTDTLRGISVTGNISRGSSRAFITMQNVSEILISGNRIIDCASGMTATNGSASAFVEQSYVSARYSDNEVYNNLTDGYGIYNAYSLGINSTVGSATVTNPRSGNIFYTELTRHTLPYYLRNDTIIYYDDYNVNRLFSSNQLQGTQGIFLDSSDNAQTVLKLGNFVSPNQDETSYEIIVTDLTENEIKVKSNRWSAKNKFSRMSDVGEKIFGIIGSYSGFGGYFALYDNGGVLSSYLNPSGGLYLTSTIELPSSNFLTGNSGSVAFSGGITLGTDLADSEIASASTWNAKYGSGSNAILNTVRVSSMPSDSTGLTAGDLWFNISDGTVHRKW